MPRAPAHRTGSTHRAPASGLRCSLRRFQCSCDGLAQFEFEHFSHRVTRQRGHDLQPPRQLVTRKRFAGEGAQLLKVERSEEHTSELQSRQYLVCRLLLEKKKIIKNTRMSNTLWTAEIYSIV